MTRDQPFQEIITVKTSGILWASTMYVALCQMLENSVFKIHLEGHNQLEKKLNWKYQSMPHIVRLSIVSWNCIWGYVYVCMLAYIEHWVDM